MTNLSSEFWLLHMIDFSSCTLFIQIPPNFKVLPHLSTLLTARISQPTAIIRHFLATVL